MLGEGPLLKTAAQRWIFAKDPGMELSRRLEDGLLGLKEGVRRRQRLGVDQEQLRLQVRAALLQVEFFMAFVFLLDSSRLLVRSHTFSDQQAVSVSRRKAWPKERGEKHATAFGDIGKVALIASVEPKPLLICALPPPPLTAPVQYGEQNRTVHSIVRMPLGRIPGG